MSEKKPNPDAKSQTIQQRLQTLSELVAWFQGPDFDLEKAVDHFKQAEQLAATIEAELTGLKNSIQIIQKRFDQ